MCYLWQLLYNRGRIEYLWQKSYEFQNLKYLPSAPLQNKSLTPDLEPREPRRNQQSDWEEIANDLEEINLIYCFRMRWRKYFKSDGWSAVSDAAVRLKKSEDLDLTAE